MSIRINIILYGITRSLAYTHHSIKKKVIEPCQKLGEVKLYGHFWDKRWISNSRSLECGAQIVNDHELLSWHRLSIEQPIVWDDDELFQKARILGDSWSDNYASLKNIFSQLKSLEIVSEQALLSPANIYVFVRPDLLYFDSIEHSLKKILNMEKSSILVPDWQSFGGYNDRFAICSDVNAARIYGTRFKMLKPYMLRNRPFHSERFLRFCIESEKDIQALKLKVRAARVRVDGSMRKENFLPGHKFMLYFFASMIVRNLVKFLNNAMRYLK